MDQEDFFKSLSVGDIRGVCEILRKFRGWHVTGSMLDLVVKMIRFLAGGVLLGVSVGTVTFRETGFVVCGCESSDGFCVGGGGEKKEGLFETVEDACARCCCTFLDFADELAKSAGFVEPSEAVYDGLKQAHEDLEKLCSYSNTTYLHFVCQWLALLTELVGQIGYWEGLIETDGWTNFMDACDVLSGHQVVDAGVKWKTVVRTWMDLACRHGFFMGEMPFFDLCMDGKGYFEVQSVFLGSPLNDRVYFRKDHVLECLGVVRKTVECVDDFGRRQSAFCMGGHSRLGKGSLCFCLPVVVFDMIGVFAFAGCGFDSKVVDYVSSLCWDMA